MVWMFRAALPDFKAASSVAGVGGEVAAVVVVGLDSERLGHTNAMVALYFALCFSTFSIKSYGRIGRKAFLKGKTFTYYPGL